MNRPLRSAILALCVVSSAGCFGRFPLLHKVYEFNQGIGNKLLRQLLFWGLLIIPVYEVAALADAVIFNLVEFWTGGGAGGEFEARLDDGSLLKSERLSASTLVLRRTVDGRVVSELTFEHQGDAALLVRDGERVIASLERRGDGALRIATAAGERIVDGGQPRSLAEARALLAPCAVAAR
ncbi:MAG: DUF3332 family protein [Myxococcales bacterium]